jgi:hypothetical protein
MRLSTPTPKPKWIIVYVLYLKPIKNVVSLFCVLWNIYIVGSNFTQLWHINIFSILMTNFFAQSQSKRLLCTWMMTQAYVLTQPD